MNNFKISTFTNNQIITNSKSHCESIYNPANNSIIGTLEFTLDEQLNEIITQASLSQKKWSALTYKKRALVFYRYRQLLTQNRQKLAELIQLDNGKTIDEALAEVDKCIELTEFSCSIPQIIGNEIQQVSHGIVCHEERRALGVVGIITPFNFPLMVPHWSIPNALMMGNAVILKPSELTPIATFEIGKLLAEAGLPANLFNIINGDHNIVNTLITHPLIKAVSFVGSTPVAEIVYQQAVAHKKRALCLGGAKNHVFALVDADPKISAKEILASAVGMAGQRCMSLSVLIIVGSNPTLVHELITQAKSYKLNVDFAPIISSKAIVKIKNYLKTAIALNAKILVNGFDDFELPINQENGNWFGPTIIDWNNHYDQMIQQEIFGPILEIIHCKNLDEAIAIQNKSPYGNSISIFSQSARFANQIISNCHAGMMGVNIGVAVPREPFSFGGLNASKFGYGDITGKSSINFWSDLIKITTKWNPEHKVDWMS